MFFIMWICDWLPMKKEYTNKKEIRAFKRRFYGLKSGSMFFRSGFRIGMNNSLKIMMKTVVWLIPSFFKKKRSRLRLPWRSASLDLYCLIETGTMYYGSVVWRKGIIMLSSSSSSSSIGFKVLGVENYVIINFN